VAEQEAILRRAKSTQPSAPATDANDIPLPNEYQDGTPAEPPYSLTASLAGSVRAELESILERFDCADQALHRAQVQGDQGAAEQAETERREVIGERRAAGLALADLLLLLLRQAREYRADALTLHLTEALRSELEPLAEDVAGLMDRRRA
jgi:hypothetical protein